MYEMYTDEHANLLGHGSTEPESRHSNAECFTNELVVFTAVKSLLFVLFLTVIVEKSSQPHRPMSVIVCFVFQC